MKKNSTVAAIIGILFAVSTVPAFAINSPINKVGLSENAAGESNEKTPEQKTGLKINLPRNTASKSGEKKQVAIDIKTDNLKNRANNEITRRITSLTKVNNRITEMKRLTEIQKSSLINDIQSEITNLTELNKKIQPQTDPETLRTDVKSIVSSHRTYLLFLPKTQIIIAANAILNAADKLSELSTKLQTKINENKTRDDWRSTIASYEPILADMQAKISDAKTQANNAINAVSALKPTDYPGNKPELQNARTMLQTAHKDLITAKQDAQKIIVALRGLNKNNSPVSPTDITGLNQNQVNLNVDSIIKNVTSTKNDLTLKSILKVKSINLKGKIIELCITNSAIWMDGYFKDSSGEIPVIFKGAKIHRCEDDNYKTDRIEYEATIEATVIYKEMTDHIGKSVGIVTFLEVHNIIEQ